MSRTDESNISFSITKPEFTNVAPTNEIALEETQDGIQVTLANEDEKEYITGLKLATVVASLTIVAFLLMMDTTIVTTVQLLLLIFSQCADKILGYSCYNEYFQLS